MSVKVLVHIDGVPGEREAKFPVMPQIGTRIVMDPAGPDLEVYRIVHRPEEGFDIDGDRVTANPTIYARRAKPIETVPS